MRSLITGLGADQLVLEAGNELARADFERHVVRRAAIEGGAVDGAYEVDGHAVARSGVVGLFLEVLGLRGDALQRLFDLAVGHRHDVADERQARMILHVEIGNHFKRHGEGEVALAVHDGGDLGLIGRQLHFRLVGRLQVLFLEQLLRARVDGVLQHFGHGRTAIDALEMRHRHLAGAEALDVGPLGHVRQLGVQLSAEFGLADHHLVFALEASAERLGNLHRSCFRLINGPVAPDESRLVLGAGGGT